MKFASSYEPNEYEADIYAAWEAANVFKPTVPTVPVDNDSNGIDDRFETELGDSATRGLPEVTTEDEGASPVTTGRSDPSPEGMLSD